MLSLDVRTFGETWFLEIWPDKHLRDALFYVRWDDRPEEDESDLVSFPKTRVPFGEPILLDPPEDAAFAFVRVVARDVQGERVTGQASLEVADYIEAQRVAGVLAGSPADIDERNPSIEAIHAVGKEIQAAMNAASYILRQQIKVLDREADERKKGWWWRVRYRLGLNV